MPYLTYCHLTWHFCSATDKGKLERIQERALRAGFLDKQSSNRTLLHKSNLMTLQNRRLQDIAVLMYMHCSPYNLRVSEFVIPRFATKKYGKHSLSYLGPKLWNRLPGEIRSQPSLGSFKHRIRKCDLSLIVDESNCLNLILCNS